MKTYGLNHRKYLFSAYYKKIQELKHRLTYLNIGYYLGEYKTKQKNKLPKKISKLEKELNAIKKELQLYDKLTENPQKNKIRRHFCIYRLYHTYDVMPNQLSGMLEIEPHTIRYIIGNTFKKICLNQKSCFAKKYFRKTENKNEKKKT